MTQRNIGHIKAEVTKLETLILDYAHLTLGTQRIKRLLKQKNKIYSMLQELEE